MKRVGSMFAVAGVLFISACGNSTNESPASTATATPEPTATATPAPVGPPPIVLMHGMAGWTSILGYEYFNGIPEALRADGWTVYTTQVDPYQSVEVRAAEASSQIDAILAETGAPQVIIIGHSQGGLDARYLISTLGYGDRVKTLATIATPHHGSKISDVALGLIPGNAAAALTALTNVLLGATTGSTADLHAQMFEITNQYCDGTFNPANPDDPRVTYYSVTGKSQPWVTVDPFTTDIVNPLLLPAWWLEDGLEGDSDGLVGVASAHWGSFLGTFPADHLDEIGQPPLSLHPAFDQVAYYRTLAAFLEGTGPSP